MASLFQKFRHRLLLMRLNPIRVFVFHQVSEAFDPESMWECDWTQTEAFKLNILNMRKRFAFISLEEAQRHLKYDKMRWKRYAVLTADDGWDSLRNILPWLAEQRIHTTIFLNPLYMDGAHKQYRATEQFLSENDVQEILVKYSPYISVASHGWSHEDCTTMSLSQFQEYVVKSEQALSGVSGKVPFYAFAWGKHKQDQVEYLRSQSLVPVFVDGMSNINDSSCIHRECLDGKTMV